LPFVVFVILLIVGISGVTYLAHQRETEALLNRVRTDIEAEFKHALGQDAEMLRAALSAISRDARLIEAFEQRDRDRLLALVAPTYADLNTHNRVTHFYFHGPDRVNFLRVHQPPRHGDTIDRFTALGAERTGLPTWGVELGPLGTFTLRFVVPWQTDDRLIGYLELGEEIDHVLANLREQFGVELFAFIDKSYLDRTGWESGMRMLGRTFEWDALPNVVLASETDTELPLDLLDPTGPTGAADSLEHDGRTHALFRFPLVDAGDRRVAHLVTALDTTARREDLASTILIIAGASVGGGIAVIVLFWFILGRAEARHRRAEARQLQLGRILDLAHDQVLLLDASSLAVLEANRGARSDLGYSDEALKSLLGPELILLDRDSNLATELAPLVRSAEQVRTLEGSLRCKDGSTMPAEFRCQYVATHTPPAFAVIATDITDRQQAERERQLAVTVFRNSAEAMMVTDADNLIIAVNPAFTKLTGYEAEDVIGRNPRLLSSDRHDKEFYRKMWEGLTKTGHWHGAVWNRRKDGTLYAQRLAITAIHDRDGTVLSYVGLLSDVTEEKLESDRIRQQAHKDEVTGLPNRHMLLDSLTRALHARRRAEDTLAVLFLDLDGFKPINDTYGHGAGDLALQEVARRLVAAVRKDDVVGRLGGDEFVVLLRNTGEIGNAEALARKVLDTFAEPFDVDVARMPMGCSIGVALSPLHSADAEGLLAAADRAMYRAKSEGKGTYRVFDPEQDGDGP
jgi:diguanylate cyclase (GGDEF)-like protein/PAS domain S-box-containing protein